MNQEVQKLKQQGYVALCGDTTRVKAVLDSSGVGRRHISLHQRTHLSHKVAHQQVGCGLAVGQTSPLVHRHLVPRHMVAEFGQQPSLAYARLTDQANHLALPPHGRGQVIVEQHELPLSAHKGTPQPGATSCNTRLPPQKLFFGHHAIPMLQQVRQQLASLGPQGDGLPHVAEFILRWIKNICPKAILHAVWLL